MAVLFGMLGIVYSPLLLVVGVLFGGVSYILWTHGTGRLAARLYRRVEQQAAANAQPNSRGRRQRAQTGGFGAGPREEWRGPRSEQRARARGRGRRARQRRASRQSGQQRTAPRTTDRPSPSEAYQTLGLDPQADEEAVKAAYREKVKDVHPDTEDGDEEQFKEVTRAYERLTE